MNSVTQYTSKYCGWVCSLSLLAVLALPVQALQVTGLYSQQVAVANESDAERNRAFRDALAAVIVKVTGNTEWLEHPAVEAALNRAQSYVEAISYSSELIELPDGADSVDATSLRQAAASDALNTANSDTAIPGSVPAPRSIEQRYVNVDFAAELIDRMLLDANIPVWGSNRPSVLVWMSLQNEQGERRLLTGAEAEIIGSMADFGEVRGLPIIFPVLDFEDRRNLSEDLVWTLDEESIRRASERYGADSILSGRLHFTASGELVGLWQFIFQDEVTVFDGFSTELQAYLNAPLNRVTTQLASYFAIIPEASTTRLVRLRVDGIGDIQDYSALVAYVSNLDLVQSVAPATLQGERLELQLGLAGDSQQLFELIALDRDLLPIRSANTELDSVLHYRWTR